MNTKERSRRRFLKEGAALAGLAVGGVRSVSGQKREITRLPTWEEVEGKTPHYYQRTPRRTYGTPSPFEAVHREPKTPGDRAWATPLDQVTGIITPSGLHFEIGPTPTPDIDPRQHRLLIQGMVDRPVILTMEELKRLPAVSRIHFVECEGNGNTVIQEFMRYGGMMQEGLTLRHICGSTSCSEWTGVLLSVLLKEAGVQEGARWVVAESADPGKNFRNVPLDKAMDDVMVAYGQNGEAIRPEQGYPIRLLVPGWEGNINVKWLRQLKVTDRRYAANNREKGFLLTYPDMNPDEKGRWFQFELGPKSIITFPSLGRQLPGPGFYEISGLAWAGAGAIRRVEISTDGGRTWKDARLDAPVLPKAHTRFRIPWNWDGKEVVISSRCTDEKGHIQPTLEEYSKLYGVPIEHWVTTSGGVYHWNPINPFRISQDGKVHNAIYPLPL